MSEQDAYMDLLKSASAIECNVESSNDTKLPKDTPPEKCYYAWNLMIELRKEILSSQQFRMQLIGFKIVFISAMIGYILSNFSVISKGIVLLPAIASMLFDLLISGQAYSIKRIGYYSYRYLEPIIKEEHCWPDDKLLWEDFMHTRSVRRNYSSIGNFGMTLMALIASIIFFYQKDPGDWLFLPLQPVINWRDELMLISLAALFIYDMVIIIKTSGNFKEDTQTGNVANPEIKPYGKN